MKNYIAKDRTYVIGKGVVCCVRIPLKESLPLVDEVAMIDEKREKIARVELSRRGDFEVRLLDVFLVLR